MLWVSVKDLVMYRDVTKFAFEFDDVRTLNVFIRFEIRRTFFYVQSSNLNVMSIGAACLHRPATGTS